MYRTFRMMPSPIHAEEAVQPESTGVVRFTFSAWFLTVFGLLCTAAGGYSLFSLVWLSAGQPSSELFQSGGSLAVFFFCWYLVLFAQGVIALVGAWSLVRRRHWSVCVGAALVVMVPSSPIVFVSLPVGIWLLVMLRRPHVRQAFD